jgi:hypothetical protein
MTPDVRVTPVSTASFSDSVFYTFTKPTVNLIYPSAAIWVSVGVLNALFSTTSQSVSHRKRVLCTMMNYFFGLIGYVITMAASVRLIALLMPRNTNRVALPHSRGPILSLLGTAHFVINIKLYLTVLLKPLPKLENSYLCICLFMDLFIIYLLFIHLLISLPFT